MFGTLTSQDFLKAHVVDGDASTTVACAGRGKIFHIACDVEPRGFVDGSQQLALGTHRAAAEHLLRTRLNASSGGGGTGGAGGAGRPARPRWPALAATLRAAESPFEAHTKDQDKAAVGARLLAHYVLTRVRRFFLAVGFASTHVHAGRICMPNAVAAAGGHPLGPHAPLAPSRATEHHPPLLTWPNWDLTTWHNPSRSRVPRFDALASWQREAIGEYYACATHVDAQIGALLDAVDALGLGGSTSVVVQGDHGFSLGRHGRWSKYHLYEDATRVPLIIAVPGWRPSTVHRVVESLDVMPTLLDLWGVPSVAALSAVAPVASSTPPPALPRHYLLRGRAVPLDGQSLLPYLRGDSRAEVVRLRSYARSELHESMVVHRPSDAKLPGAPPKLKVGRGVQLYVRSARHAYTAYLQPQWQPQCRGCGAWRGSHRLLDETLYDHATDATEQYNLAYSTVAAHVAARLAMVAIVVREWNLTLEAPAALLAAPNRTWREAGLQVLVRQQLGTRHSGGGGGGGGRGSHTHGRGRALRGASGPGSRSHARKARGASTGGPSAGRISRKRWASRTTGPRDR